MDDPKQSKQTPFSPPNKAWPEIPMEEGKYYQAKDPNHNGTTICAMTWETWLKYGTAFEQYRVTCMAQDKRIKELLSQIAEGQLQVEQFSQALGNLRAIRRKEKRAELEGGIILEGDRRLTHK